MGDWLKCTVAYENFIASKPFHYCIKKRVFISYNLQRTSSNFHVNLDQVNPNCSSDIYSRKIPPSGSQSRDGVKKTLKLWASIRKSNSIEQKIIIQAFFYIKRGVYFYYLNFEVNDDITL